MNSQDVADIEAALADQEQALLNIKGKHIKSILSRLERLGVLSKDIRKIVLDEINDLTRENLRYLGFDVAD